MDKLKFTFGRFLVLLALATALGWLDAENYVQGFTIRWKLLPNSPELPSKILAINKGLWIESVSGRIYYFASPDPPFTDEECSHDCWKEAQSAPADGENIVHDPGCGIHSPSTSWLKDVRSVCEQFGVAAVASVYGFDSKGRLYHWKHILGDQDGLALILFPVGWALFALIAGVLWAIVSFIVIKLIKYKAPNTACTRRAGVAAFSSTLCGLELVPIKWRSLVPPTRG
jgi:hypothetical protein